MSGTATALGLDFTLPAELAASAPAEARGLARDGVRLLTAARGSGELTHTRFRDLPGLLRPGDLLVVNTSATLPAAVRLDRIAVHFSTPLPGGDWLVELRERRDKPPSRTTGKTADATTGKPGSATTGKTPGGTTSPAGGFDAGATDAASGDPTGRRSGPARGDRVTGTTTHGTTGKPTDPTSRPSLGDTGPTPRDTGPSHADTAPTSRDTGPSHADTGPTPRDIGPSLAGTGPRLGPAGPTLAGVAPAATGPYRGGAPGEWLPLPGGATLTLLARHTPRLWRARLDTDVVPYLHRYGVPIRYDYVPRDWPLAAYQTVFARPGPEGSAEMPSAGRAFSFELVTRLVAAGVLLAPITLHTGVASPEAHEPPYPERYEVPDSTARLVNDVRGHGGRVIAVGTTVVRALETAAGAGAGTGASGSGGEVVRASRGWTDLVVTPERGARTVDGIITGLHEPSSSHLWMLAAIAGLPLVERCYGEALDRGYLWHEFGDLNLLLP